MDFAVAAAGLSHAITIAKAVRDADKALDRAVLRAQMAEVMDKATDAKFALSEARDVIAAKDSEISRLTREFGERAELEVGAGDYKFRLNERGHKVGYPFCPRCDVMEGRVSQLKQDGSWQAAKCPVCTSTFAPVACYVPAESGEGTETMGEQAARAARAARQRDTATMRQSPWV